MSLTIITADQRMAEQNVKGTILALAGVGKTTLLKTLDAPTTLCISAEGGLLSVQRDDEFGPRFAGDTIEPANWLELKSVLDGFKMNPRPPALAKYKTIFIDSISVASKWCLEWAQTQPEAVSEKTGKPNLLGAYGLLGREMEAWAWGWKNLPGVNVWFVGGLERKENDIGQKEWLPLMAGSKLASALPYIMDFVIVMARFKAEDGKTYTGFFTDPKGEFGTVPVKTRGGGFSAIEQPHLGKFMAKALGRSSIAPPPSVVQPEPGGGTTTPLNQTNEAA
jgi:hypothetical protein